MSKRKYLIVGSSHAGLSALEAIRTWDREGGITLLTQERHLPYSPTILPHVVVGQISAQDVFLRDQDALRRYGVDFRRNAKVVSVKPQERKVSLETGETLEYENLLLATGSKPALPPITGLKEAPYHVLRTLDDALRLQRAAQKARSVIVLGAGLIGLHAAESLAKQGRQVTLVEAMTQILPGYFDQKAAGLVQRVFSEHGIKIRTESMVTQAAPNNGGCILSLGSGSELSTDLLLVATGVNPRIDYLEGSGIEVERGILVDRRMRASAEHLWAAGDVAQAQSFLGNERRINAIIPNAVEQGRIAGMDMVGDSSLRPFTGGLPMYTYRFLRNNAFSVGISEVPEGEEDCEVEEIFLPDQLRYQKFIFKNGRLLGASGVNSDLDPGIISQLIGRGVDLKGVKSQFLAAPAETGRILMSRLWR